MHSQTKNSTIHFDNSFFLPGADRTLPPGDYRVLEDIELVEGLSWIAYRRTATYVEVPAIGTAGTKVQRFKVDFDELTAMLGQDRRHATSDAMADQASSGSAL